MDNLKTHLKSLIQLAVSDQNFSQLEKMLIYAIGKAHKVPEADIDKLIEENLKSKGDTNLQF